MEHDNSHINEIYWIHQHTRNEILENSIVPGANQSQCYDPVIANCTHEYGEEIIYNFPTKYSLQSSHSYYAMKKDRLI